MSLEVGIVTKSKNGEDILGLLYCLSTLQTATCGRAGHTTLSAAPSEVTCVQTRAEAQVLHNLILCCSQRVTAAWKTRGKSWGIRASLQPSECHSSILHEVGGDSRTPRPESLGPAEDNLAGPVPAALGEPSSEGDTCGSLEFSSG